MMEKTINDLYRGSARHRVDAEWAELGRRFPARFRPWLPLFGGMLIVLIAVMAAALAEAGPSAPAALPQQLLVGGFVVALLMLAMALRRQITARAANTAQSRLNRIADDDTPQAFEQTTASGTETAAKNSRPPSRKIAGAGTLTFDTRSKFLHASDEALALLCLEATRFDHRLETVLVRVHPADRARVEAARKRLHAGEDIMYCEYRIVRPDGKECTVRETGSLTPEIGDRPQLAVTVLVDVTEQLRREHLTRRLSRQLAATRNLRKLFIYGAPDVMCAIHRDGRIFNIGGACKRLWNYSSAELRGTDFRLLVHPDDRERTILHLQKGAPGDRVIGFDNRHLRKDGSIVSMQWKAFWSELDGMTFCVGRDIDGERRKQTFEQGKQEILARIASHAALANSLESVCQLYDRNHPGAYTSILLLDESSEHLRHGAAPGLPEEYNRLVDGVRIEPNIGSCCEAILRRSRIISGDIGRDPVWTGARDIALQHGLRACWSTPIISSEGNVLGTFGIYYREPRSPSDEELRNVDSLISIAGIAIDQHHALGRLDTSRQQFTSLFEQHPDSVFAVDRDGRFTLCNSNFLKLTGRPLEHYIGHSIDDAVPKQFRAEAKRHLAMVLDRSTCRGHFGTVDSQGNRIEVDMTTLPIVVAGQVTGAFTVVTDVTPLHLAQEELQRSLKHSIRLSEQLRHLSNSAIEANVRADDEGLLQILIDALRETIGAREAAMVTADTAISTASFTVSPAERQPRWSPHVAQLQECGLHNVESLGQTPTRLTRDQIAAHTGWRAFTRQARGLAPHSGWLGMPLTARDGQNVGFLHLFDPADGEFNADDELVATQFAQMISVAVARRQLIARLQVRDRFFEMSLEPFCIYNLEDHRLIELNDALCQALGRTREYLIKNGMEHLAHADDRAFFHSTVREAYLTGNGGVHQTLYRYLLVDGSWRFIEWSWYVGVDKLLYAVGRDITERQKAEAELAHAMTHDAVTDLPRIEAIEEDLRKRIEFQSNDNVSVMFMDLDRFFSINELMGHATADRVLRAVAQRILQFIPKDGSLGRMSGDEFLAVLPGFTTDQTHEIAEQIRRALLESFAIDGYRIRLSVSIGIAAYPAHGASGMELVRRAQAALVNAKRQGRDAICVFTAEQVHDIQDRQLLGNHLRDAVERNEMVLHYQPQYDAETRRLDGFEALIRWRNPELGLVFPSRFISVAESIGVMPELGQWIIREACRQMREWRDAGHDNFVVSVNVSAQQLLRPGLAELVKNALDEYQLPAHRLEIELTESTAMENVDRTHLTLHALKALGVRLALDDFGTGYSSLAYLKQFQVDKLKIDKSFVRDLPDDANDAAIARTIIGVGHQFRMRVSAEGVETARQRDFLIAIGCDELQGFLFSPGVPAADATRMLAAR